MMRTPEAEKGYDKLFLTELEGDPFRDIIGYRRWYYIKVLSQQ
jgi:hypothetical protein